MGVNTAGNLEKGYFVAESTFGVTPTTDPITYMADILEVLNLHDPKREDEIDAGSRAYSSTHDGCVVDGFEIKARARLISGAYDWRNFFMYYAIGGIAASADVPLPSFTGQISKKQGSTYYRDFYSGSKCDIAKIIGEEVGKPITFNYKFLSQYLKMTTGTASTSKAMTGHQAVTVGADPTPPTTAKLSWSRAPQINIAGGGLNSFKPKKFTVRLENHLEPEEGFVTGNDGTDRAMATAFLEGEQEIWFECEGLSYNDETYNNAKMGDSAITELVVRFQSGEYSIHLANGYFPGKDMAEYKQALIKQGFIAKFKTITLS